MSEPSRRSSRLALASVSGAAFLCAGIGFVAGRLTAPPVTPPDQRPLPTSPVASNSVPVVVTPSVLTRAGLIEVAQKAIDGQSAEETTIDLRAYQGRRFELRLPFGCHGPSGDETEALRWQYDEASETLRISISPQVWPRKVWLPPKQQTAFERIEGFWISRPWTSRESCSSVATQPSEEKAAVETLGLAMFVSSEASRTGRQPDESFEVVKKVKPEEIAGGSGFRLRVTGRLTSAPSLEPVSCKALDGANQRPTCLIAVSLDEIAVENASSGTTLATWTISQPLETPAATQP